MELTFHSMDELREFLAWRDEQHERALNAERPPVGPYKTVLVEIEAADTPPEYCDGEQLPTNDVQSVSAPKRTRRTKAQIEADRQAAEQTAPQLEATVQGDQAEPPEMQDEPGEPAAKQQPGATDAWPDEALILERASHIVADPAAHLKESRDFIAAWGLPAYFETQQAAKVGNNAITYEAGDRARHAAVMQLYAETHNKG